MKQSRQILFDCDDFDVQVGAVLGPDKAGEGHFEPDLSNAAGAGIRLYHPPTPGNEMAWQGWRSSVQGEIRMSGSIRCSAVYPTLAVPSVEDTCSWYVDKLGFTVRFLWGEPPTHGAILLGDACVHFWNGIPQLGENWFYFDISDLDAMYRRAKANDVEITRPPEDYPWGMREFNAIDLNGYNIRFGQHFAD